MGKEQRLAPDTQQRKAQRCQGCLTNASYRTAFLFILSTGFWSSVAQSQPLSDACIVSILNQTAFVQHDGGWLIPNVPSNMGLVRARITCVEDGRTVSGSSDFFPIVSNRMSAIPPFALGASTRTPVKISVSAPSTALISLEETVQLTVTATFTDGSTSDVTSALAGTLYGTTNSQVATVGADGVVKVAGSGRALVTALHEAIIGGVLIDVSVTGDTDGDGLPDDLELANSLDPNDPVDALEDLDADGLTNRQELLDFGTGIRTADSDSDGILDGEEVVAGADGFVTNPLLADTDGDGLRDRLEVTTGSDPTNPTSYNLALALQTIAIAPTSFSLVFTPILGEVSQQLRVTGRLTDGFDLDLTSATRGTSYLSSDIAVCNSGSDSGRVFAGANGICTITAQNSGFSAQATGTVRTFTPAALSFLPIPGGAKDVDVNGNFAYVAADESGLLIVNVANRFAPVLAGFLQLPGYAYDVKVVGNLAFVAGGPAGLEIVDVGNPASPVLIGSLDTPGDAKDIAVSGDRVLVADGPGGVQVVDVSSPAQPILLSTVPSPTGAPFLDVRGVDRVGNIAVIAGSMAGSPPLDGVIVIDLNDELNPVVIGQAATGNAQDVVLQGRFAFVAELANGFTVIDLIDPARPLMVATIPSGNGGLPADVAVTGNFAFGADTFFGNLVSIFNIASPSSPFATAFLDFNRFGFDDGTGVAIDQRFVYLTGSRGLYIGRYMWEEDTFGIPPTVAIVAPTSETPAFEGGTLSIRVQAMDDIEIAAVDFLVDDASVVTDTTPPYSLDLTIPAGTRNLTLGAKATDIGGNASFAQEVRLTVTPNSPPTVAIVAPAPGTTITEGGVLSITVQATDDIGIQAIGLLVDGVAVNTDMVAPYEFSLNAPVGSRSLRIGARALDIGGLTSFAQEVEVTVTPNQPPTVQIVSPATGATVMQGDRLRINAHATDDVGVASVTFLANGSTVVTDALPPYEAIFTVPVGALELILGATATDVLGAETTALEVPLTVIPDPGTAVVGRVLDGDRLPVGGADVRCVGQQGLSGPDGRFSITGVSTLQGSVQCVAFGAGKVSGRSPVVPAVGGATTDVGDLILSRRPLYPGAKFGVGDLPIAIVGGDFDGDGLQDLATANLYSADLSVLMGTGDGGFGPERRLGLDGYMPEDLLAADFDGDGKLDLASVGERAVGDSSVSVFLGSGDGSFLPSRSSAAGQRPQSMIAADFDRDGGLDLAIVGVREDYWGTTGLSVLLGNGDGTFAPGQSIAVSEQPTFLAVGDFDGDGAADLVASYPSQNLALLLGNGDGTLRAELRFGQGLGASGWSSEPSIAAGDFNSDGRMDLAAVKPQMGEVALLLGNGNGTFQPAMSSPAGPEPTAVWPAELDGDGQLDLVTLRASTHSLCLLKGTGTGSFPFAQCLNPRPIGHTMAITDFNQDRLADFVIGIGQPGPSDALVVFMGDGDGLPEALRSVSLKASPQSVAIGDLDRDGSLDIVTANSVAFHPNGISVRLGRGDGTFESETNYESRALPRSVALGDFNLDGSPDLALADASGISFPDISIQLGRGDGTFQARQFTGFGTSSWQLRVTDLDADGAPDLVAPQRDADQVLVLSGNGDGTFRPQPAIGVGRGPVAVTFGDFNRDGARDFVSVNSFSQDLSIVLGNGNGTFQLERRIPLSSQPAAIAAADLDSDGVMDLVVATVSGSLEVLLSNGNGTLQAAVSNPTGLALADVVVADVDQSGQPDLVAVHDFVSGWGEVSVLLGNGDGTFQGRQRFAAQYGPGVALATGDLDRDGSPDLVVATSLQPLAILIGGGSPARGGAAGPFTGDFRHPFSSQVCRLDAPALTFKAVAGVP